MTSIEGVVSDYIDKTDYQGDLDEDLVKKFAIETAQKLVCEDQLQHMVALVPIKNYTANYPEGFTKLVQMALKEEMIDRNVIKEEVVEWVEQLHNGCEAKITIECPECHEKSCRCGSERIIVNVDDQWLRANDERNYWKGVSYYGVKGLNKSQQCESLYHPGFSIIKPAQHNFFGTNYHIRGCVNLDRQLLADCTAEYKLEQNWIRTNVKQGYLLIAYLAIVTDDDGYMLIPDDSDVFEAIFWAIEAKMLYQEARRKKDRNVMNFYSHADQKKDLYFRRAKEKLEMVDHDTWMGIVANIQNGFRPGNPQLNAGRYEQDTYTRAMSNINR